MVANSIQNLPAFVDSGQHSIVTAPADTGPSPRMRNLTLRGSGSTSFLPAPVVALSCNRLRTLIIVCALLHWDIDNWTGKDSESPPRRATYRPTLGNCVSSAGSSIIAWLSASALCPCCCRLANPLQLFRGDAACSNGLYLVIKLRAAFLAHFTIAVYFSQRFSRLWADHKLVNLHLGLFLLVPAKHLCWNVRDVPE